MRSAWLLGQKTSSTEMSSRGLPEKDAAVGMIATTHAVLPKRVKRRRGASAPQGGRRELGGAEGAEGAVHNKSSPNKTANNERDSIDNRKDGDDAGTKNTQTNAARKQDAVGSLVAEHGDLIQELVRGVRAGDGAPSKQFEYLDHTADVQLHAWGATLERAFEEVALCMFNYMTPLEGIEGELRRTLESMGDVATETIARVVRVEAAKDMDALMFHWLDELLFGFSTEFFVPVRIRVVEFDAVGFGMTAVAVGDVFDSSKHACGTEIKAITYSAMQILDVDAGAQPPREQADVYVIVDI